MARQDDGYTFVLSDEVTRTPVRYENRFGIEVAADLYQSKDLDTTSTHPALVIGPPHGGVKEQGPGVYAQEMARRGFVAVAFDPSYNGESSGEPRHITSPEVFAEDFSAGVDFLGTLRYVNRDRIGAIGKRFSELVVVPGARHIDLYDRTDLIPFDTLETFFLEQLD